MAGIQLTTNFDVKTGLPLDSRIIKADITARNAIPALERYLGLEVYVLSDKKKYILKDGLLDANWTEPGGGGSGGGISLQFLPSTANGAIQTIEYDQNIFLFDTSFSSTVDNYQKIIGTYKVPSSYVAGTQLKLKMISYSKHTSGTVDIKYGLLRTLISKNTGDITNVTPSTVFTEVLNPAQNIIKEFIFDLTNTTGQINGVAIAAGDLIKLQILRTTPTVPANTGTEESAILTNSFEVI